MNTYNPPRPAHDVNPSTTSKAPTKVCPGTLQHATEIPAGVLHQATEIPPGTLHDE